MTAAHSQHIPAKKLFEITHNAKSEPYILRQSDIEHFLKSIDEERTIRRKLVKLFRFAALWLSRPGSFKASEIRFDVPHKGEYMDFITRKFLIYCGTLRFVRDGKGMMQMFFDRDADGCSIPLLRVNDVRDLKHHELMALWESVPDIIYDLRLMSRTLDLAMKPHCPVHK